MTPRKKSATSKPSTAKTRKTTAKRASLFSLVSDRRWVRWSLRAMMAGLAVAFTLSLVVYPVRDYLSQRGEINRKQSEFEALADANEQLFNEVQRLQSPEGVRGAARSQLGYVMPGEERIALTPMPSLPTTLPDAWPYTLVSNILRVRAEHAGAATGALAPLAP